MEESRIGKTNICAMVPSGCSGFNDCFIYLHNFPVILISKINKKSNNNSSNISSDNFKKCASVCALMKLIVRVKETIF